MKQKIYPILIVLSCCVISVATMGLSVNCLGVFFPHMAKSLSVGIGSISLFGTIMGVATGFWNPMAIKLAQKISVRLLILNSIVIEVVCYYFLSLANSLTLIYILSLIIGICNANAGSAMISFITANWFDKGMGTASGIALGLSGLSGAILSPVFNRMIEISGWQHAMLIIGISIGLVSIPAFIFIVGSPEKIGLHKVGESNHASDKSVAMSAKETYPNADSYDRTALVLLTVAISLICMIPGFCAHFANYAVSIGRTTALGAVLMSGALFGNMSSKFILGPVCDVWGVKRASLYLYSIISVGLMILLFAKTGSQYLLVAAAFMIGLSYASCGIVFSLVAKDIFGIKHFPQCYGVLVMYGYLSSSITSTIIGFSYDLLGSYTPAAMACLLFTFITVILIFAVYKRKGGQR